ncbi:hypothetical protein HPP92_014391 [Vanilla planifolia]|uniref:Endonuclease/exonuclease/phosphatase domain-containing protein n=1 Tax=Vanilla planifolia TaxID=51239 RepID=A0A835QHA4_VANPL|nr:hypothetical protein HPP92_014391 [Vanilla planifolia]
MRALMLLLWWRQESERMLTSYWVRSGSMLFNLPLAGLLASLSSGGDAWTSELLASAHVVVAMVYVAGGPHIRWCVVYSPMDPFRHSTTWHIIKEEAALGDPMIVAGDFNIVMAQEKKRGGRPFCSGTGQLEFLDYMQDLQLTDLGFTGNRFTWCNGKKGNARILEWLDRALINLDGLTAYPTVLVNHLARISSDHCPIVIDLGRKGRKPTGARRYFENIWLDNPHSTVIVKRAWAGSACDRCMDRLNTKFCRSLAALSHWSRDGMWNVGAANRECEKEISHLQTKESTYGLSNEEDACFGMLIKKFHTGCALEEKWW